MISTISLSNVSCQHDLPKGLPSPKPIPVCDLIATDESGQYLRCRWNASGEVWRVPISKLYTQKIKYICTTEQGVVDTWNWTKEVERWADRNCNISK